MTQIITTNGGGGGGGSGYVKGPNGATNGHLAVFDGTTGKLIKDGGAIPQPTAVVDDLTSTSTTSALSANQGRILKGMIDNLMAQGRFLSLWNCTTGLPISFPLDIPYEYSTGDYFMVEVVDDNENPTNYRPSGSSYDETASTTLETGEVAVGDYYVYDGAVWLLASNHGKEVSFANIAGEPSDNTELAYALGNKQDKLIAGTDLEITTPQSTTTVTGNDTLSLENAVKNSLNSITAYGGDIEEVERIPGYTLLEYIDGGGADSSTRTYIDTGVTPVANTLRIKYKGQLLGEAYGGSFIGAVTGTVPRAGFRYFSNANNGQLCLQTYSYTYSIDMGYDVFDTDITVNNQTKKLTGYVNSTTLNETNSGIDLNFNKNMLIHGIYLGDNVSSGTPNRCYWCLIEKNGVVVRDFVPVIRNSDNEIGYYDKVSQTFFPNLGPGTFTAGPVKGPRNLKCNNGTLKVRQSIADFSSGLIRRSTNTQISLSSSKCGIEYTFKTSAGYIGKVFPVTVGNKYTINYGSKSSSTGSSTSIFYIELNNVITKIDDNYGTAVACPYTFTATKPYVGIWLGYPNVVSGNVTISVSGLTLIEGEIPANTIYTDGTTETIEDEIGNTATAEMLLKVGDKADTQEILTGAVTRNVRVVTFDGSETFASSKTGSTFRYTFDITDYPQYVDGVSSRGSVVSSHFTSIHSSSVQTPGGAFTYNGGANNKKLYLIPLDQNLTTVALFKEWVESQYINGTPLIAMYPLDTAGTETVTGQILNVIRGDNDIDITQASITPLSLTAIYEKNVSPTINFTNDTGYITSSSIPTNVSSFTNDSGYITSSAIPTNVSSFTNDSGYLTSSDLTGYQTTSNMVTSLSNPDDNHYPTTLAVSSAISSAGGGDVTGPSSATNGHLAVFDGTTGKVIKDGGVVPSYSASDFDIKDLADTTGLRTTWSGKQDALTTQTVYSAKGSATKVPQITTNSLGQVTAITEKTITHPSQVSNTAYASSWNGVTATAPSKNAVYDKIESVVSSIPTVPTNVSSFTNDAGYTTNTGTITSVKMNGSTVSSSGEADLGTVITSHQNIKTINNNSLVGSGNVTINEPIVSSTAPSSPTEGMIWYDTTNDKLKTYNGSSWDEAGSGTDTSNTKTFYISSTSDLTNAQAAYDWYVAGKNPIIQHTYSGKTYPYTYILEDNGTSTKLRFKSTHLNKVDTVSSSYTNQFYIEFTISSGNVTTITTGTMEASPYYLSTSKNYGTPYTPLYDGSPATKKYVDDNAGIQNDTTGTTSTLDAEWVGTQTEFNNLSTYGNKIYNIID